MSATPREDYTSKVPHRIYAETLAEQEAQLAEDPILQRFRVSRAELVKDPHHPRYHLVSPEVSFWDPNGFCYWQGRYHLFYQINPPEDPRQHWGHAVSDNLVHWEDWPYAIYPNPESRVYSGSALAEDDRVIAFYHGTDAGAMAAISADPLLLNWEKVGDGAVIPLAEEGEEEPFGNFDPCMWKQGDHYYALTARHPRDEVEGHRVREWWLHRSADLEHWEYLHPFVENDLWGRVGDDGACPYFWPIGPQLGKHLLLHYSHTRGGKFLLGDYDTERQKFIATDGGDLNFGPSHPGGIHAPSAFPDGEGGVVAIFNVNPARPTEGWNHLMSLPRRYTLGADGELRVEPAGDMRVLRGEHQQVTDLTLPANQDITLDGVAGRALELQLEIDLQESRMVALDVFAAADRSEFTRIAIYPGAGVAHGNYLKPRDTLVSIDTTLSSTLSDVHSRAPEVAPVAIGEDETIQLRVFIDHSVVEVFVNGKQCLTQRVYPASSESCFVTMRAQGSDARLLKLDAWQMDSIYPAMLTER
jgi:beta-fructofuranosidase